MPTLFRILLTFAVLVGLGYGALWSLANMVEPQVREMTYTVPLERMSQ